MHIGIVMTASLLAYHIHSPRPGVQLGQNNALDIEIILSPYSLFRYLVNQREGHAGIHLIPLDDSWGTNSLSQYQALRRDIQCSPLQ